MHLIIGGDSAIGSVVARAMRQHDEKVVVTSRRAAVGALRLDLGDSLAGWRPPHGVSSACICAAVSKMADCGADPVGTAWINVAQTASLVERLTDHGVYTLFLSSNQVFDGSRPLVPCDEPRRPVSEYGRQKAQTEKLLEDAMGSGAPIGILRLSKVVAPGMPLLADWANSLAVGRRVSAFGDMFVSPVPTVCAAEAIRCLMRDRRSGIHQLSGPRDVSYAELARIIATRLGASHALVVEELASARGVVDGMLPRFTSLDSSGLRSICEIAAPDIHPFVARFIDDLRRRTFPVG